MDAIRQYVKGAFEGIEPSPAALEQQEEIIADLNAKVEDLMAEGKTEQEALGLAISSVGDLTVLAEEFRSPHVVEPEPAPGPRKRRGAWIALSVVVGVLLLCVLCGLAGLALFMPVRQEITQVSDGPKAFEDMQREYRQSAAKLALPPGVSFPAKANGGAEAQTSVYSEGYGISAAQLYWINAWEREWLAQRERDEARAARALEVLADEVPRSEFMTTYSDDVTRSTWREYVKQAKAGDPSGFERDVEVNPGVPPE